jgi:diguanylate cyclase (GGDEF)-like protein
VKEQARRDSLTGAYNHGHLLYMLNEEVIRGREQGSPVSLIMLDIDYFKQYNDRHGHVIGDEVLRLLVKAIQEHVKKTDIVGRWGGEEFSIGLPGATTDQAYLVAKRVRETLAVVDLRDKNGQSIPNPTVSQGIATFPKHAHNTDQLVDVADIALYQAKHLGRDQVVIAE